MNYQNYLQSEDWKTKRSSKRRRKNNCAICNSKDNLDVHHLNYKNLVDVSQSDLRVLCRRCHFLGHELMKQGKVEFKGDNHHSMFTILKAKVKKELGVGTSNMFM